MEFHSLGFPAPVSKVPQDGFFFLWIIIYIYIFKDHLDGVFVLSLHSEQPVNKEFSAVSH